MKEIISQLDFDKMFFRHRLFNSGFFFGKTLDLSGKDYSQINLGDKKYIGKKKLDYAKFDHSLYHPENIVKVINGSFFRTTFNNSSMSNTSFFKCDLNESEFNNCDLTNIRFNQCPMNEARFRGSRCENLALSNFHAPRSQFNYAKMQHSFFLDITMDRTDFYKIKGDRLAFENCHFESSHMAEVDISQGRFINSWGKFLKAEKASFKDCHFININFEASVFHEAKFINCQFSNINFRGAILIGVNFSGSNLKGVDFEMANLDSADFDQTILENITLKNTKINNTLLAKEIQREENEKQRKRIQENPSKT